MCAPAWDGYVLYQNVFDPLRMICCIVFHKHIDTNGPVAFILARSFQWSKLLTIWNLPSEASNWVRISDWCKIAPISILEQCGGIVDGMAQNPPSLNKACAR